MNECKIFLVFVNGLFQLSAIFEKGPRALCVSYMAPIDQGSIQLLNSGSCFIIRFTLSRPFFYGGIGTLMQNVRRFRDVSFPTGFL
jgi:hypothetical protein